MNYFKQVEFGAVRKPHQMKLQNIQQPRTYWPHVWQAIIRKLQTVYQQSLGPVIICTNQSRNRQSANPAAFANLVMFWMSQMADASKRNLVHVIMEVRATKKDLLYKTIAIHASVSMEHGNALIGHVQVIL